MSILELAVPFLRYAPGAVAWTLWALAVIVYFGTSNGRSFRLPGGFSIGREKGSRALFYAAGVFLLVNAITATVVQYLLWSSSAFTDMLLHSKLENTFTSRFMNEAFDVEGGYFAFFAFVSIWLELLLAAFLAFVFWLVLKTLRRHNDRFFEDGEVTLGLFAALLSGWPNILLFIFFTFFSVVAVSIFRLIFIKEAYTTLGAPFLLALLLTLLAGPYFIELLGLSSMDVYRVIEAS